MHKNISEMTSVTTSSAGRLRTRDTPGDQLSPPETWIRAAAPSVEVVVEAVLWSETRQQLVRYHPLHPMLCRVPLTSLAASDCPCHFFSAPRSEDGVEHCIAVRRPTWVEVIQGCHNLWCVRKGQGSRTTSVNRGAHNLPL